MSLTAPGRFDEEPFTKSKSPGQLSLIKGSFDETHHEATPNPLTTAHQLSHLRVLKFKVR